MDGQGLHPDVRLLTTDPDAVFDRIDTNGGGSILFDEFCNWAIEIAMPGQQGQQQPPQGRQPGEGRRGRSRKPRPRKSRSAPADRVGGTQFNHNTKQGGRSAELRQKLRERTVGGIDSHAERIRAALGSMEEHLPASPESKYGR